MDGFPEIIGSILAFSFTFMVLLYAVGDNALFRLMIHLFIGVAAGYASAIAVRDVLLPQLWNLWVQESYLTLFIVLVWISLLLLKISPKTAVAGNPASALLVGVGGAIAVGGAIQGTLIPQISGASSYFNPVALQQALQTTQLPTAIGILFNGAITLLGTVTTLIYFHFSARYAPNQIPQRNKIIEWIGLVGKAFISITFGVIFAGVYSAALVALIERFTFIVQFFDNFMGLINL